MEICRPTQQSFHNCTGGGGLDRTEQEARRSFIIAVEDPTEQFLFVAERRVQTGPRYPERFRQVGKRRAFVTLPPEEQHGAMQSFVEFELARTSDNLLTHIPYQW